MKSNTTNRTFLFAQCLGENQYTKHQVHDRWYDDRFVGSTEDMWNLFQADVPEQDVVTWPMVLMGLMTAGFIILMPFFILSLLAARQCQ